MMSRLGALIVVLAATASGATAFQQRDGPSASAAARTGTASISGVVVTDGPQPMPLRRATVTLSATSQTETRTIATDDAGRFVFRALSAGRYQLNAVKGAYLRTAYGSKGPARVNTVPPGTALVVADGQQVADLTIKLARGAVIAGTVRDPGGKPAVGTTVSVGYYFRLGNGERTLGGATGATTDDRGAYRIYGIAPGDYVIMAQAPILPGAIEVGPTTAADLQRAQNVLNGRATQPPASAPTRRHESVWYSQTYFPGTSTLSDATVISIAAGEERAGLDFQLQLVPTARVEGTVIGVNGQPAANVMVRLGRSDRSPVSQTAATTTDAQGRFRFTGIQPSSCSLIARTSSAGASPDQNGSQYFGLVDIEVRGEDITADMNLQPGANVSGRVVLEDSVTAAASELGRVRMMLAPVVMDALFEPRPLTIQPDGSFLANSLAPGRYRVVVTTPPGGPLASMFLKSAVFGGQDVLDTQLDIQPGQDITGATVTLTQRTADIMGKMLDANGAPAPEYFIIAFSADSRYWTTASRRIQQARPARDGSFTFRNLPPGDYLIAAVTDIEQGQWFDPDFLKQLVAGAIKVTLGEGQKKSQDIRLR